MPSVAVSIFEVGDYEEQVARAATLLREGGAVVLPTETVYGVAAQLNRPTGVARLNTFRGKPEGGPFTIHIAHAEDAAKYLGEVSFLGKRMMQKLWPGPVGLMFEVSDDRRIEVARETGVSESDLYAGNVITLRCPDHMVFQEVVENTDGPVALTLIGNGDGRPDFTEITPAVDLVLDAGPAKYSKPSTILRVKGDQYEIVRVGIYDQRIIERLLRTTVLFVCSGNTCRSPMAEALARQIIASKLNIPEVDLESRGISVVSAGSYAMPGSRATPAAVEAVRSMGADLSRHRSRPLTVDLIHEADAIFTMGRAHAAAVTSLVPSARNKTSTLDPTGEIEDPIGSDLSNYQSLAAYLKPLIERRLSESVLKNIDAT